MLSNIGEIKLSPTLLLKHMKNHQKLAFKKGGVFMDVKSYCDSLVIELTGWKAKVYDVVRKLDKMSSGDKAKSCSSGGRTAYAHRRVR